MALGFFSNSCGSQSRAIASLVIVLMVGHLIPLKTKETYPRFKPLKSASLLIDRSFFALRASTWARKFFRVLRSSGSHSLLGCTLDPIGSFSLSLLFIVSADHGKQIALGACS